MFGIFETGGILLYLAFCLPALASLRNRDLDETAKAIWALLIVAVPIMGPLAYAIVSGYGRR